MGFSLSVPVSDTGTSLAVDAPVNTFVFEVSPPCPPSVEDTSAAFSTEDKKSCCFMSNEDNAVDTFSASAAECNAS